jgi:hypothetical protein
MNLIVSTIFLGELPPHSFVETGPPLGVRALVVKIAFILIFASAL